MSVRLRGYAIPFNSLGSTQSGLEVVMRGAFTDMISARHPVRLQFNSHEDDAPALADTTSGMELFEDAYGLAFHAELDDRDQKTWEAMRAVVCGAHVGASVSFITDTMRHHMARFKNEAARHVESAFISHINITDAPVYKQTCVWRADTALDEAPWRVRDLNDRWERGYDLRSEDDLPTGAGSRQRAAAAFRISNTVTERLLESPMRQSYERAKSGTRDERPSFKRSVADVFKKHQGALINHRDGIRALQDRVADLERRFNENA